MITDARDGDGALKVERSGPGPISPLATQHMVHMRDGVRLATDVYLPDGDDSPGPVLLTRLPYDKNGAFTPISLFAEFLMSRGYRVVAQDVRGKFRSEGEQQIFANEADDGYDTIEWISQQTWCDGNVAMWGNSYYGFTQLAAMTTQHPALKAISPRLTGTGLGQPHLTEDGITRGVEWTHTYTYPLMFFHENDNLYWEVDWSRRPYLDSIAEFLRTYGDGGSRSFDQWYPRARPLRLFRNVAAPFDARAIPTLFTIGWWDNCAPWSWRDVEAINARSAWRNSTHLLIEPVDHYSYALGAGDTVEVPTEEQWRAKIPRILGPTADFFDHYVRNIDPDKRIPAVRYTVAHADGVRTSPTWPPSGTLSSVLSATAEYGLRLDAHDRTSQERDITWLHDPEDLVPSPAPDPFKVILDPGDPRRASEHPGVVRFTSAPLSEPLEIVGAIHAKGRFISSGPNMDIFVRLIDVAPDGQQIWIARGNRHILDATVARDIEVGMDYAGYRVAPGHQLVVELASSDFPEYVPQPGTGEDPFAAAEVSVNRQSVLVGGDHGLEVRISRSVVEMGD